MLLFSKKENSVPLPIKSSFLWLSPEKERVVLIDQTAMLLLESRGRERGSFIS